MVSDTGERYQTTPLFKEIQADMSDDELEISRSTVGYQFDVTEGPKPPSSSTPPAMQVSEKTAAFVAEVLQDPRRPVVMFALDWCEFCWSVRNLFDAVGIPYSAINLDAATFEGGPAFASELREILHHRTSVDPIPRVLVNGTHVGGATEAFDAFNAGTLQSCLKDVGIQVEATGVEDAYRFLPRWLQSPTA